MSLGPLAGPVIPYHLGTLSPLLTGLLDQLGYTQADVLGISCQQRTNRGFGFVCPGRCPLRWRLRQ